MYINILESLKLKLDLLAEPKNSNPQSHHYIYDIF